MLACPASEASAKFCNSCNAGARRGATKCISDLNKFHRNRALWEAEMAEETILTGDDLMMGPPSPVVPTELASHVLDGIESCSTSLRRLFHCLHVNDIEPFCQDHIILYRRCSEQRDGEIRNRIQDAEKTLALTMPENEARERQTQLKAEAELLERRMILASGLDGVEGFRQRWSIHGRLYDTNKRIESIDLGLASRQKQGPQTQQSSSWWKW